MSREIELEDGTKETVYTADEMAAKDKEILDAKQLAEDRGKNFNGVNEKITKTEEEITKLRTDIATRDTNERNAAKTATGMRFHGGKDELKAKVDENYAKLAGMPETTPQEVEARMEAAARLSGISVESAPNPLYSPIMGEAPQQQAPGAKEDEFLKSEKGVAAQKAMGFTDAEITPTKQ